MTAKAAQWWQDQCWLKLASGWENALSSFSLIKCLHCVNSDNNLGLPPLSSATTLYLLPTYISLPSSQKNFVSSWGKLTSGQFFPTVPNHGCTYFSDPHRLGQGPWIVYVRLQFIGVVDKERNGCISYRWCRRYVTVLALMYVRLYHTKVRLFQPWRGPRKCTEPEDGMERLRESNQPDLPSVSVPLKYWEATGIRTILTNYICIIQQNAHTRRFTTVGGFISGPESGLGSTSVWPLKLDAGLNFEV